MSEIINRERDDTVKAFPATNLKFNYQTLSSARLLWDLNHSNEEEEEEFGSSFSF